VRSRALVISFFLLLTPYSSAHPRSIDVTVDAGKSVGRLNHIWNGVGAAGDNNLVAMRRGENLLKTLSTVSREPFYRQTKGLTSSGDGSGSTTNIYHTDKDGNAFYDFTVFNQIYDQVTKFQIIPVVSIGFMPDSLSSAPEAEISSGRVGNRYPPKDYSRWYDLVYATVSHAVARYGKESVSRWYWEVWNEPDLHRFWKGSATEYMKLYDYTAAAVKAALPEARVGGSAVANPDPFFRSFLEHCLRERNHYTGKIGAPLDFISFHVKGGRAAPLGYFTSDDLRVRGYPRVHPSLNRIMEIARSTLRDIASTPGTKGIPIVLTEADIDWGARRSKYINPNLDYRNSEYFAVFQIALAKQMLDLDQEFPSNRLALMIMDTFYYEGSRIFEGQRTLITADDIEKPILNALRMLGKMGNTRIPFAISETGSVDGFASRSDDGEVQVQVYNWDEGFDLKDTTQVNLSIKGLVAESYTLTHYRIDHQHSNAHNVWRSLGEPLIPDENQLAQIRKRQGLEMLEPTSILMVKDGDVTISLELPPYSVSLIVLYPKE
jgi:xylan 1,4-beta-xylosidase